MVPEKRLLEAAKQTMGREVFSSELTDRQSLMDELAARTPATELSGVRSRIQIQTQPSNGKRPGVVI